MTPLLEGLKSPPVPTEPASPQAEEPSVEDNQDLTDPQPVAEAIPEAPTEPIEADQNPVDEPNPLEEQVRQLQLQLNELQERFDQRVEHGENLAGQVEALTARQDQLSDQQADLAEKQIKAAIEAGQKSAENPLAEELQQIQSRLDELQVGLNERGEHADTLFVQLDALSARQDQLFDQQAEFAAAREAHDLSIARTEEQLATQQDQLSRQIQTAYEALEVRLAELEQRTEAQPGPEGTLTPLGQQSAQLPEATLSSIELRLANLESFAEAQEAINAGNQEHFAGQNQTLEDFRQHLAQQQTDLEGSLGHINSQLEANEIKHQEHAEAIENLANAVGGDDSRTPATGGLNQRFDELAARVQQRHHTPLPGRRPEQ
jgi:chromosome segregation ATPase